jgi:hypothetical protein
MFQPNPIIFTFSNRSRKKIGAPFRGEAEMANRRWAKTVPRVGLDAGRGNGEPSAG